MALVKEIYSVNGVNRIYQLLKNEAEKSIPRDYDVKVDGFKVVDRNSDPERFFEHEAFLHANSKDITVNIYDGSSPRCTRYMLQLSQEEQGKEGLSGIEKSTNALLQQEKKSWEYEKLKKDNAQLSQELQESSRYAGKLEEQLIIFREEKQKMPGKITETLMSLAGAYISRNPAALNGIPILGQLFAGGRINGNAVNGGETDSDEQEEEDIENEATFNPVEKLAYTNKATDTDFERLENALVPLFPEQYRDTVATVINVLYHNHALIPEIAALLSQQEHANDNKTT